MNLHIQSWSRGWPQYGSKVSAQSYQVGAHFKAVNDAVLIAPSKTLVIFSCSAVWCLWRWLSGCTWRKWLRLPAWSWHWPCLDWPPCFWLRLLGRAGSHRGRSGWGWLPLSPVRPQFIGLPGLWRGWFHVCSQHIKPWFFFAFRCLFSFRTPSQCARIARILLSIHILPFEISVTVALRRSRIS